VLPSSRRSKASSHSGCRSSFFCTPSRLAHPPGRLVRQNRQILFPLAHGLGVNAKGLANDPHTAASQRLGFQAEENPMLALVQLTVISDFVFADQCKLLVR
jgi:hypothetical protein